MLHPASNGAAVCCSKLPQGDRNQTVTLPDPAPRHARRASHHHAPQAGALNSSAQTAIDKGPSSPANTDAATVSAPRGIPIHQAARRYPRRQSLRQPRARGSPHGASTIKDDDAMIAAVTHIPASEVPPASGRNRAAACTTTPTGNQSNASGQNPRRFLGASLSMPTGCTVGDCNSRGGVDKAATWEIGTLRHRPVPEPGGDEGSRPLDGALASRDAAVGGRGRCARCGRSKETTAHILTVCNHYNIIRPSIRPCGLSTLLQHGASAATANTPSARGNEPHFRSIDSQEASILGFRCGPFADPGSPRQRQLRPWPRSDRERRDSPADRQPVTADGRALIRREFTAIAAQPRAGCANRGKSRACGRWRLFLKIPMRRHE